MLTYNVFILSDLPETWEKPIHVHKDFVVSDKTDEWKTCVRLFKSSLKNPSAWSVIEVRAGKQEYCHVVLKANILSRGYFATKTFAKQQIVSFHDPFLYYPEGNVCIDFSKHTVTVLSFHTVS